ncbi:MAG: acyl-CoA thioesterase [Solirubrobacteraceae bacterium]
MDTVFDRDTAVTPLHDGAFAATIAPNWRAGRGPHGGYLAAILLRALTAAIDDPARTPRSLTIHYAASPELEAVEIHTTVERAGRSLSTLSARMQQNGRLIALALAAFSVPWQAPGVNELPMPELGGPDAERRSTPGLFKGAPEFTKQIVLQPRVGAIPFAGSGAPMRVGGWTGLPEPRPVDALALALFCDAWFPPSFIALDSPAVSPTVDLTIHFRQPISACDCDPSALCLGVFETRLLHDGLFEEDGVIWAPDGAVLAQSRQLGIIMPTDKPVLQPATLAGTEDTTTSRQERT